MEGFTWLAEPKIVDLGPYRAVGMSLVSNGADGAFSKLWESFIPREGEIQRPEGSVGFGICRCAEGATDGAFEYIAALGATPDSGVPEGMISIDIPFGRYVEFPVRSLAEIGQAWGAAIEWMNAHSELERYCGPGVGCDCAHHPCFELYPPEFCEGKGLFIYVPVKG